MARQDGLTGSGDETHRPRPPIASRYERKVASFRDDLHASLTRLEHTAERLRRRTILFTLWGVVTAAAIVVRIIAEAR